MPETEVWWADHVKCPVCTYTWVAVYCTDDLECPHCGRIGEPDIIGEDE